MFWGEDPVVPRRDGPRQRAGDVGLSDDPAGGHDAAPAPDQAAASDAVSRDDRLR